MADEAEDKESHISVEQELRRKNEEWVRALVNCDGATLGLLMADDCIFTYPLEGDDKAQFINDIQTGEIVVEYLDSDNVDVRIYGVTAIVSARDTARWLYAGREISGQYRSLHVYAKRDAGWQIVAIQSCPIKG